MYSPNVARENFFDLEITDSGDGYIAFRATGALAELTFQYEAGGHRWQRVPPNDKKGRVHTSTVTVAVLAEPTDNELRINPGDLEWAFTRGSGAGGQNRNVTNSAVDLVHRPTGVSVHCESERSQFQNKANALSLLRARLWEAQLTAITTTRNKERRSQVGTGTRGDKSWTIRMQDDQVTHHQSGQKFRLRDYMNGNYDVIG